jgi:uncharacterized membrane protein YeaQ/YmgE (transglycosylase-associated protein family)
LGFFRSQISLNPYTFPLIKHDLLGKAIMEILGVLIGGVIAGNVAALFLGGYSLGAIGNSIAGMTGSYFLSGYMNSLFGLSKYSSHVCAGVVGALFILIVFRMAESIVKKSRIF